MSEMSPNMYDIAKEHAGMEDFDTEYERLVDAVGAEEAHRFLMDTVKESDPEAAKKIAAAMHERNRVANTALRDVDDRVAKFQAETGPESSRQTF